MQSFALTFALAATTSAQESAPAEKPAAAEPVVPATESPTPEQKPPPPTPIELQPYRVRVVVAFDDHPTLTVRFREQVLAELATWIDRTYAQMWQFQLDECDWLAPANLDGLSRLNWPQLETQWNDPALEKAILLVVSVEGGLIRLGGREWDRLTKTMSATQERLIGDRRAVTNELGVVIRESFRPLLLIDGAEGSLVKVRLRAGEFPAGDPSAQQLTPGAFYLPLFRYLDKDGVPTQIQFLPWTYLAGESVDRSSGTCITHTGLRVPLGKNSKRMQNWAIGLKPTFAATRLRLTPHNNPTKPLIGYQVNLYERRMVPPEAPPPEAKPAAKTAATKDEDADDAKPAVPATPALVPKFEKVAEFVTDRRGRVTIPADQKSPLIWMYVSSGGNLLGRFPFIPGVVATTTAELPDDGIRLQLESRVELLRAELIDTVARRALLMARVKAAARSGDNARFNEALSELERQPAAKQFHAQWESIKVATLKSAKERKDRGAEGKLAKVGKETEELIDRHLGPERLKELRDELIDLKKTSDETRAAEAAALNDPNAPATTRPGTPRPAPAPASAPSPSQPKSTF